MKNSRISLILNSFSKKEIRELRKWLISPAHNQRQDVQNLFEYLVKNIGNDSEMAFEKEFIFKKLFLDEKYDDARFRQTIHFLAKATEEFLTYQELVSDEVRATTSLARVFRRRGLDKLFNKTINSAKTLQKKAPFRNTNFQQNEFQIQLEEYAFRETKKRTAEMNLQELTTALDVTFIANKLKYSYLMFAHRVVYNTDYDFGTLDSILKYVRETPLVKIPAISIYYHGLMAQLEKDKPEHYQSLKTEIFESAHLFPNHEARDIYLMSINYLIGQLNSGSKDALKELFELYKSGLQLGVFMESGRISRFTFMNVVAVGLKLSEFEWIENFINEYQAYLKKAVKENIVHFSTANLAFEKKDYDTAMRQLTQVEYDDILMNLNAKGMLIKMFYETGEYDVLEALLNSTRAFITRKKVMGARKANFTNLIKLTKKLLKIQPYDKTQIARLRNEIEEANPMASTERDWLLNQLSRV